MSRRVSDPTVDADARCAICGDPDWRAAWHGHVCLCVCRRCAIEALPRLIADATWIPGLRPVDAEAIVRQITVEYWRALAHAAMVESSPRSEADAEMDKQWKQLLEREATSEIQ